LPTRRKISPCPLHLRMSSVNGVAASGPSLPKTGAVRKNASYMLVRAALLSRVLSPVHRGEALLLHLCPPCRNREQWLPVLSGAQPNTVLLISTQTARPRSRPCRFVTKRRESLPGKNSGLSGGSQSPRQPLFLFFSQAIGTRHDDLKYPK
jgi:hypothetical protein